MKIYNAKYGTPEWHAFRKSGVGGSEVAAALGLSKWKTPYQLWLEKTTDVEPLEDNWNLLRGRALEPALRQEYANVTEREVSVINGFVLHDKYDFMFYSPDGISPDGRLQEFKSAAFGHGWGEYGSDEIPQEYALQVQYGLLITKLKVSDCMASIGAKKPELFLIDEDLELQKLIENGVYDFWMKVRELTPPEPINEDDLKLIYAKKINANPIAIQKNLVEILDAVKLGKRELKEWEKFTDEASFKVKAFMGEFETLLDGDGNVLATWKKAKDSEKFNLSKFKDCHPKLYSKFLESVEGSRRFLVK